MIKASVIVDKDFTLADIDPRLYGGFIEHLGRHIYTGIFEPGHPTADKAGYRQDVLDMVKQLNMPIIRYPGGNFVSGFDWEDSVGPVAQRPRRLDLAWKTTETNQFGLHEFMDWSARAGAEAMLAVNLGTRGIDAARNLVEYCNHPSGSLYSDMRRKNGAEQPFNIKVWCLGNEMDGPWEIAAKSAGEYGALARETAKAMKWVDESIQLVLCGSSNNVIPTFGAWELEALDQAYEQVDYLSLHHYFKNLDNDPASYLAQPEAMHDFIRGATAACDAIAAKKKQRRKIMLSFDEWNVWTHTKAADREIDPWREAPRLLEEIYTMEDALVVGGMLIALLNNADRVRMACLAQVVNVLAPIMTEPGGGCWAQTTFFPFRDVSSFGRGVALRPVVKTPLYDAGIHTAVPTIASAVTYDAEAGRLAVFLLNRSVDEHATVMLDVRSFNCTGGAAWSRLSSTNLKAANTKDAQATIAPVAEKPLPLERNCLSVTLPPASWNCLTIPVK